MTALPRLAVLILVRKRPILKYNTTCICNDHFLKKKFLSKSLIIFIKGNLTLFCVTIFPLIKKKLPILKILKNLILTHSFRTKIFNTNIPTRNSKILYSKSSLQVQKCVLVYAGTLVHSALLSKAGVFVSACSILIGRHLLGQ